MKIRTGASLAAIVLALSGAPALPAQAQQPENEVAECVRGHWESTGFTVEHPAMDHFQVGGGGGVSLMIEKDGTAKADFDGMDPATFSGEAHNTTVRGSVEFRGEATGTVSTAENNGNSGTMEAADVDWKNVDVTVALTEPFDSRPVDRVSLDRLRQLALMHGHRVTLEPVLSKASYQCADDTLTLTSTIGHPQPDHQAELSWTFERTTG
jgi:hypothetical protein